MVLIRSELIVEASARNHVRRLLFIIYRNVTRFYSNFLIYLATIKTKNWLLFFLKKKHTQICAESNTSYCWLYEIYSYFIENRRR